MNVHALPGVHRMFNKIQESIFGFLTKNIAINHHPKIKKTADKVIKSPVLQLPPAHYEETRPLFTARELNSKPLLDEAKNTLEVWQKIAVQNKDCYFSLLQGPDDYMKERFSDSIFAIDALIDNIGTMIEDEEALTEKSDRVFISINPVNSSQIEAIAHIVINNESKELSIMQLAGNPENIACPMAQKNVNKNPVRGAGNHFIEECVTICKEKKLRQIHLISSSSALGFYQKNGFSPLVPGSSHLIRKIEV